MCLMMTAPYIIGGDSNMVRESEMPNAHSMVRKTVKRKVVRSQKEPKISERKKHLILEGDDEYMPKSTMDFETKKYSSILPVSISGFQSTRSKLCLFIRRTLVASGLSKTQTKKVTQEIFPSNGKIRRMARKQNTTTTHIKHRYRCRQFVLHQYLSEKVHVPWTYTFFGLQNAHRETAETLVKEIDSLGGYKSLADIYDAYDEKIKLLTTECDVRKSNNKSIADKYSDWWARRSAETKNELLPLVSEADLKTFPELRGTLEVGDKIKPFWLAARAEWTSQDKQADELLKAATEEAQEQMESIKRDHAGDATTILYKEMKRNERIANTTGLYYEYCTALSLTFTETSPWMNEQLSISMVKEHYLLSQLEEVETEENDVDFAFLHHPNLIWHQRLAPELCAEMLSVGMTPDSDSGFRIPRTNKPVFKGKNGLKEQYNIANIRQLSESIGLPTRIDDRNGFKELSVKELWTQYHNSSFDLHVPTGILAELGREFNGFFDEGNLYKSKWAGETYQFTTPTLQSQQEEKKKEKRKHLLRFNFG